MAVYQPTYKDPKTKKLRRSKVWWYEFTFEGQRIRESAKTTRKGLAQEAERNRRLELERAVVGAVDRTRINRIRRVRDVIAQYLEVYPLNHREGSVKFVNSHLPVVSDLIGELMLADLSEERMRAYVRSRISAGVGGRTINMELGELSRAIGKKWRELWPGLRKLEERKDVGRALSPEEEQRLMEASWNSASPYLGTFVSIGLMTGMRFAEIISLRWGQVNMRESIVTVGIAKSKAGSGRAIPMNDDLVKLFQDHAIWYRANVGQVADDHFLFARMVVGRIFDPKKRLPNVNAAWIKARKEAKVQCRFHDLRHTVATKLAEAGVSESTMLALMGHMSRAMLERYSHIRMAAKRTAVQALALKREPVVELPSLVPTISPKVGNEGRIMAVSEAGDKLLKRIGARGGT